MTRYVRATFANGHVAVRSSESKVYTHAYFFEWEGAPSKRSSRVGFSTSAAQCAKNLSAESAWAAKTYGLTFSTMQAVEEIAAAEYRGLLDNKTVFSKANNPAVA